MSYAAIVILAILGLVEFVVRIIALLALCCLVVPMFFGYSLLQEGDLTVHDLLEPYCFGLAKALVIGA